MTLIFRRSSIATQSSGGGSAPPDPPQVAAAELTLTSTNSGTLPWTFGHAFEQGDVPSGQFVTADSTTFQADVRNVWPDGSVKFAVLSGTSVLVAGVAKVVTLGPTAVAPTGSNVAEPTTLDVAVTITGDGAGTYTLQSCLGVDRSTWSRGNAGRVRSIAGRVMSEYHYYRPTADTHLAIWFYVRRYANGSVEVETVLENGWVNIATVNVKTYTAVVAVNGSTVFSSGSLSHFHHTRWSRVDWIGTAPSITPKHNAAYLRATRMVPNYNFTSPTTLGFTGLASALNPTPFALGDWSSNMSGGGTQDSIGPLPRWESLYGSSTDSRAYAATISNNRGAGRWPIHYRDENTGRPPRWQDWVDMNLFSGWGPDAPPSPSGGGPTWDIPHHPSNGYLAYLIEGRWPQLESLQFSASFALLDTRPSDRALGSGGVLACIESPPLTTRGAAWAWRTVGQCAAISPETLNSSATSTADTNTRNTYVLSYGNTMAWMRQRFIEGSIDSGAHKNSTGWVGQYDGGNVTTGWDIGPDGEWWGRQFMWYFQLIALAHVSDLRITGLAVPTDPIVVRDHMYNGLLPYFGDNTTWNFRRAAQFDGPWLKNESNASAPSFMTIQEKNTALKAEQGLSDISANSGDTLKQHGDSGATDLTTNDTSSAVDAYWAQVVCCLQWALDHGFDEARIALNKVQAASNYDPDLGGTDNKGQHNHPQFAFAPRAAPDWYTSLTSGQWNELAGGDDFLASGVFFGNPGGALGNGDCMFPWCSAVLNTIGLYVVAEWVPGIWMMFCGGGHSDSGSNAMYALGPFCNPSRAPDWVRLTDPSNPPALNAARAADGKPSSCHTYDSLIYRPVRNQFFTMTKPHTWTNGDSFTACDVYSANVASPSSNNPWTALTNAAATSSGNLREGLICYDRARDRIYHWITSSNGGFDAPSMREYNPVTDAWTTIGDKTLGANLLFSYPSSAYDPVTQIMCARGSGATIKFFDLTSTANGFYEPSLTGVSLPTTDDPGILWDPEEASFVIKPSDAGRLLYKIARPASSFRQGGSAWTVSTIDPGAGVTPGASANGIFKKLAYIPRPCRGYLLVPDSTEPPVFLPRA